MTLYNGVQIQRSMFVHKSVLNIVLSLTKCLGVTAIGHKQFQGCLDLQAQLMQVLILQQELNILV
jgi:hypothetical protein